ncbi:MAG: Hypothetical protein AJITA_00631 [Acetilactobacillus jinshanensis]
MLFKFGLLVDANNLNRNLDNNANSNSDLNSLASVRKFK